MQQNAGLCKHVQSANVEPSGPGNATGQGPPGSRPSSHRQKPPPEGHTTTGHRIKSRAEQELPLLGGQLISHSVTAALIFAYSRHLYILRAPVKALFLACGSRGEMEGDVKGMVATLLSLEDQAQASTG